MRSRLSSRAVPGLLAAFVILTGSACTDSGEQSRNPTLTMAVDTASGAIVDQLRASNVEVYLGEEPSAMVTLDGIDATAEARAALEEEVAKIQATAKVTAAGETASPRVDAVDVRTYGEPEWKPISDGKVSATVDVLISRHYTPDDVDSAEVIPHEITLDAETGKILEIVVQDQDYENATRVDHS